MIAPDDGFCETVAVWAAAAPVVMKLSVPGFTMTDPGTGVGVGVGVGVGPGGGVGVEPGGGVGVEPGGGVGVLPALVTA